MIALSLYNTTIHSVTNLKPQEVFYGIKEGDERPLNIERIIENRNKVFDEVILKLKEKQKITLDYQNATKETEPLLETDEIVYHRKQGIKPNLYIIRLKSQTTRERLLTMIRTENYIKIKLKGNN